MKTTMKIRRRRRYGDKGIATSGLKALRGLYSQQRSFVCRLLLHASGELDQGLHS